jgi:SAM-dependent methyltransferase
MQGSRESREEGPRYGTWIRKGRIIVLWAITGAFVIASTLGLADPPFYLLALGALPFAYIATIVTLTYRKFSPAGGDYQDKIHLVIVDRSKPSGNIIDIGCGSGRLLIRLAASYPGNRCTGVDYWGEDWEYSKAQCEANARAEHAEGLTFIKASASKLPFEDGAFDWALSCLTFHEVRDVSRKTDSLKEALRVLRKGGGFVFLDLFGDPKFYPGPESAVAALRDAGATETRCERLSDILPLPFPLNGGRALKHAVLIEGRK